MQVEGVQCELGVRKWKRNFVLEKFSTYYCKSFNKDHGPRNTKLRRPNIFVGRLRVSGWGSFENISKMNSIHKIDPDNSRHLYSILPCPTFYVWLSMNSNPTKDPTAKVFHEFLRTCLVGINSIAFSSNWSWLKKMFVWIERKKRFQKKKKIDTKFLRRV